MQSKFAQQKIPRGPLNFCDGRIMFSRVLAVEQIQRMRGGAQSHLMRCSDGRFYVVKFPNNPQGLRTLANEMLCGLLAQQLDLPSPPIAIVEVWDSFIEATKDLRIQCARSLIPCQAGLCFGSLHAGSWPLWKTGELNITMNHLPPDELANVTNLTDFAGMLVFDQWTCNTDGRQVVFVKSESPQQYRAVMIDNGFCFGSCEWNFPDSPLRGQYVGASVCRGLYSPEVFEPWLSRLEIGISHSTIRDAASLIPPEWYQQDHESLTRLVEQLDRRRHRTRELVRLAAKHSLNRLQFGEALERGPVPHCLR